MEMTRFKCLLAAATVAAAIIGFTPNAHAQVNCLTTTSGCSVHFVGVGSSAQYLPAAIGADALALTKVGSGQCVFHWSAKNNANLVDNRGTVAIPLEPGNEWIVWIANQDGASCPTSTGSASIGNTSITDIWLGMSVDSTVGNRAFLAQNTAADGGSGVAVETIPVTAGNLLGTGSHILWPDNAIDVSVLPGGATNIPIYVGTDQAGIKDVHVNAGMTDIRAEDALYATTRSMAKLNATLTGLGYNNTTNVGLSILTSEGTGTKATPVKFALSGSDPITKQPVRSWTTFTVGAAPVVFIYNNGGDSTYPTDIVTGVLSTGTANTAGSYKAANLFDGTTACTTLNPAFDAYSNGTPTSATNITLFLREPLSGTMNTTEFNVFRTTGNTSDSQEKGVNPATANPLANLACASGGVRSRGIGTGEIVGTSSTGVLGTSHSLGYIFTGFANLAKFGGSSTPANYNYLTVDGIDPFGFAPGVYGGEAAQQFPNCAGPCAASTYWTGSVSFPNLRNGSYKVWSIYRWDVPSPDTDPYGPTALAQATEDNIDNNNAVADFVPFATSSGSDGLEVYRSHRTEAPTTCTAAQACNGTPTNPNSLDGGNTLGVGDSGGDVGGLIEGPFGTPYTTGHVDTTTVPCVSKKGYEIHFESGDAFVTGASWEGLAIEIGGVSYQVSTGVPVTATALYVGGSSTSKTCTGPVPPAATKGLFYNITGPNPAPAAVAPGVIGKKM
jgi:hypothetical protein